MGKGWSRLASGRKGRSNFRFQDAVIIPASVKCDSHGQMVADRVAMKAKTR